MNVSRYPVPLHRSPYRAFFEQELSKRARQAAPQVKKISKELAVIPSCNHIEGSPSFRLVMINNQYFIIRSVAFQEPKQYGPFNKATAGKYWLDVIETIEQKKK